jgi:hypothetical protein
MYNNISTAYRYMARRGPKTREVEFVDKAKKALLRAIELSTQEGLLDVWSAAQFNLGGMLAEQAQRAEPSRAAFLRIQSVAAFMSSSEAYPGTSFAVQLADTQLSLGRVLLEQASQSIMKLKEMYLFRSINAIEAATEIFRKESHLEKWSQAQFHIGLAYYLHAEIAEPEIAVADLENAISCFESAVAGYHGAEKTEDMDRLQRVTKAAQDALDRLRAERTDQES